MAQYYINRYHKAMDTLNVLSPSIEPHASGHIIEQIELVKEILKNGYAYESEGSVYFDVEKYNKDHHYGKLSGRNLDNVLNTTRELTVRAVGTVVHKGRSSHVWNVDVFTSTNKLVSSIRVVNSVMKKR